MTPEDMVGKNDFDIYPPELAAKYARDSREVMTSGDRIYFEESTIDQKGNIQHLEKV